MRDAKEALMRTRLTIDDDVLSAAKEIAAIENKSVGEIISSLARRALFPQQSKAGIRSGVPLLSGTQGNARYLKVGTSAPRGAALTGFLLDINVLIALIGPSHVQHDRAHEWFEIRGHKGWATCPLVNRVLRIVGHPRYPNCPGSPAVVVELLVCLRALPSHDFGRTTYPCWIERMSVRRSFWIPRTLRAVIFLP